MNRIEANKHYSQSTIKLPVVRLKEKVSAFPCLNIGDLFALVRNYETYANIVRIGPHDLTMGNFAARFDLLDFVEMKEFNIHIWREYI